jgi:hypothetical protein
MEEKNNLWDFEYRIQLIRKLKSSLPTNWFFKRKKNTNGKYKIAP